MSGWDIQTTMSTREGKGLAVPWFGFGHLPLFNSYEVPVGSACGGYGDWERALDLKELTVCEPVLELDY